MRKLIFSILVILILAVIGLPYGMGYLAQKQFVKVIQTSFDEPGYQVKIINYHPGWFTSTSDISVYLKIPENKKTKNMPDSISFALHEKIYHGPVFVKNGKMAFGQALIRTTLKLNPEDQKRFDELFNKLKPKISGHTIIKFNNASESTIIVTPAVFQPEPNTEVNWQGMKSVVTLSGDLKKLSSEMMMPGLTVSHSKGKLELGTITATYEGVEQGNQLWTGKSTFGLSSFSLHTRDKQSFSLANLYFNNNNALDNNLMSTALLFGFNKLMLNTLQYGPGQADIELKNLDASALAELKEMAQKMSRDRNMNAQKNIPVSNLMMLLPKLFSQGAELNVKKLHLKMPVGIFDVKGNITIAKSNSPSLSFDIMNRASAYFDVTFPTYFIEQVLTKRLARQYQQQNSLQTALIQGLQNNNQGNVEVKKKPLTQEQIVELAKTQATQQISTWVEAGYLEKSGDNYQFRFAFQNGQATINEKVLLPKRSGTTNYKSKQNMKKGAQ